MGDFLEFWAWFVKPEAGPNPKRVINDDQTGIPYEVELESPLATLAASISALYLLGTLVFGGWLLLDVWSGQNRFLIRLGTSPAPLASATFRMMAFVAIGGALGGTVDGIRSVISWHCQYKAYGPRFIVKDLILPPLGGIVGLAVYVTVQGGAGLFNGDFTLDPKSDSAHLAAFAVAFLGGFSSLQVFRWLDAQANKIFNVAADDTKIKTLVPKLIDMDLAQARKALADRKLVLGTVTPAHAAGTLTVKTQAPIEGTVVDAKSPVDLTLAEPGPITNNHSP